MATKKPAAAKPAEKPKRGQRGKGKEVEALGAAAMAIDNAEVAKAMKQHVAFVKAKASARQIINGDISASRTGLVDRGLNRKALAIVEAVSKMEDQHRHNFELTLMLGLKAIGQPMQRELFDSIYPVKPEAEAKPKAGVQGGKPAEPEKADLKGPEAPPPGMH